MIAVKDEEQGVRVYFSRKHGVEASDHRNTFASSQTEPWTASAPWPPGTRNLYTGTCGSTTSQVWNGVFDTRHYNGAPGGHGTREGSSFSSG